MAKKSDQDDKAGPVKKSASNAWAGLTWQDLEAWAGKPVGCVVKLTSVKAESGTWRDLPTTGCWQLLWVPRYFVTISMEAEKKKGDRIHSKCSCPVGYDGCKHAVAVVAEYLDQLGRQKEIPVADAQDPRGASWKTMAAKRIWMKTRSTMKSKAKSYQPVRKSGQRTRENWDEKIKQHIHAKSREDLAELVWSLTQRFTNFAMNSAKGSPWVKVMWITDRAGA